MTSDFKYPEERKKEAWEYFEANLKEKPMEENNDYPDKEIFWSAGKWYFWDAHWTDSIGPFDTKEECEENYKMYNEFALKDEDDVA